jgi:hypothetical protein
MSRRTVMQFGHSAIVANATNFDFVMSARPGGRGQNLYQYDLWMKFYSACGGTLVAEQEPRGNAYGQ